jgi:hypothetical protein
VSKPVIVHSVAEAKAAIAAHGPDGVILESPPAASAHYGVGWWLALLAAIPPCPAVLDCGAFPGQAAAALRAGVPLVKVTAPPEVMDQLNDIARLVGGRVVPG